jgi:hypothetical protein
MHKKFRNNKNYNFYDNYYDEDDDNRYSKKTCWHDRNKEKQIKNMLRSKNISGISQLYEDDEY